SAKSSSCSRSSWRARVKSIAATARAINRKAVPAYQAVRRAASDHGRERVAGSGRFLEDIADPADGVDQLGRERVVHLRPQPADVDVHDVALGLVAHAPDLR